MTAKKRPTLKARIDRIVAQANDESFFRMNSYVEASLRRVLRRELRPARRGKP